MNGIDSPGIIASSDWKHALHLSKWARSSFHACIYLLYPEWWNAAGGKYNWGRRGCRPRLIHWNSPFLSIVVLDIERNQADCCWVTSVYTAGTLARICRERRGIKRYPFKEGIGERTPYVKRELVRMLDMHRVKLENKIKYKSWWGTYRRCLECGPRRITSVETSTLSRRCCCWNNQKQTESFETFHMCVRIESRLQHSPVQSSPAPLLSHLFLFHFKGKKRGCCCWIPRPSFQL